MTPKNKKVSTKFRANLYAFTCIACILWFAQSYADFSKAGTLTSAQSIFLLVCIGIVVAYTGIEAIILWIRPSDKEKKEMQDGRLGDKTGDDTCKTTIPTSGHEDSTNVASESFHQESSRQTVKVRRTITTKEAR